LPSCPRLLLALAALAASACAGCIPGGGVPLRMHLMMDWGVSADGELGHAHAAPVEDDAPRCMRLVQSLAPRGTDCVADGWADDLPAE